MCSSRRIQIENPAFRQLGRLALLAEYLTLGGESVYIQGGREEGERVYIYREGGKRERECELSKHPTRLSKTRW